MGFQGTILIPGRGATGTGISQTVKNSNWIHIALQEPSPLQPTSGDDSLIISMQGLFGKLTGTPTGLSSYSMQELTLDMQSYAFDLIWIRNKIQHSLKNSHT